MDRVGYPPRVIATEGTEPNYKQALELVSSLDTRFVLRTRPTTPTKLPFPFSPFSPGIIPVIPPWINRNFQRCYDKSIYKKTMSPKIISL
ncbi:MAG: hypothetical protein LBB16_00075 [Puniceicoccales bacterium]|nr:hypothetical protein [Puniceicoccales bacterium]